MISCQHCQHLSEFMYPVVVQMCAYRRVCKCACTCTCFSDLRETGSRGASEAERGRSRRKEAEKNVLADPDVSCFWGSRRDLVSLLDVLPLSSHFLFWNFLPPFLILPPLFAVWYLYDRIEVDGRCQTRRKRKEEEIYINLRKKEREIIKINEERKGRKEGRGEQGRKIE